MMSRQNAVAQRNLTLTEELEKLEQSITLTLQEIDHNFSRAHRIVTSSILPIVERYREHSNSVWEGSKFWKQFFEASANVSLSGYEEPSTEGEEDEADEDEDETVSATLSASAHTTPSTSTYASPSQVQDDEEVTATLQYSIADGASPSPSHSTPRPRPTSKAVLKVAHPPPTTAPFSSPYETLKRETLGANPSDSPSESPQPSTPSGRLSPEKRTGFAPSSPFAPSNAYHRTAQRTPANDVLLHRVLDKNWRIQATPHSNTRPLPPYGSRQYGGVAEQQTPRPGTARRGDRQYEKQQSHSHQRTRTIPDDDLDSSPAAPAPQLHAEIFDTPARTGRIPGVSILTPGRKLGKDGAPSQQGQSASHDIDLWDSDEDIDAGMSPPKTMQFHVPQSRLVRTPAREASKRIVDDLLSTAGMRDGLEEAEGEDSPSIVRRGALSDEDTF